MKYWILCIAIIICSAVQGQQNCKQNSKLFRFDSAAKPFNFTEQLGNHPEFPFLQKVNGVQTPAQFIKSIHDTANQHRYKREFKAFDLLLRNAGFSRGYRSLKVKDVKPVFITPGTIGNLGFYDKQRDIIDYIYVKLNPAGEDAAGTTAWKLTNTDGCYLYILHTCGNAFYPHYAEEVPCCKTVTLNISSDSSGLQKDSARKIQVMSDFYEATVTPSSKPGKLSDTAIKLLHHKDTIILARDTVNANSPGIKSIVQKLLVCRDTTLQMSFNSSASNGARAADNAKDSLHFYFADTVYHIQRIAGTNDECHKRWEIDIEGGGLFNAAPKLNNIAQHTQTNGAQPLAVISISRIFNRWFQAGISATYCRLTYQDDLAYGGPPPSAYNTVNLSRMIPVEIFARATIARKPIGWQSNFGLSAGYSFIADKGSIKNNGTTLPVTPQLKAGITAGLHVGIAYFFSCKFGIAVTAKAQYFNNNSALQHYSLFAIPVTASLRFRF